MPEYFIWFGLENELVCGALLPYSKNGDGSFLVYIYQMSLAALPFKNKSSILLLLSSFLFLLLFEGLSKWLFATLYRESLLIDPNAHLPSSLEWITHSLVLPRVWLRAVLCSILHTWMINRFWIWVREQNTFVSGLLLLFFLMLPVMGYQLFLYRGFSLENLKLFQPELVCFLLTLVIYYTPIALALAWFLKHFMNLSHHEN